MEELRIRQRTGGNETGNRTYNDDDDIISNIINLFLYPDTIFRLCKPRTKPKQTECSLIIFNDYWTCG